LRFRAIGFFSSQGTIELYEAATGRRLRQLPLPEGVRGVHLTFAPGGDRLAAVGVGPAQQPGPAAGAGRQQVCLWELSRGRLEHVWPADEVGTLGFTPDGRALWAVEGSGAVRLWDAGTCRGWGVTPPRPD